MGNAGRVLMIPKGDYNAATTYEMLDCVYYNGRSYVCKQTSTGNLPTNTTYWQVMTPDSSAEIQALTNYVLENNVKNICPFDMAYIKSANTSSWNGNTYTQNNASFVYDNGTVTISGVPSAVTSPKYALISLSAGEYILSGCPTGGSDTTYALWVGVRNASDTGWITTHKDYGNGVAFTVNADTPYVRIETEVRPAYDGSTKVFKPMIRLASITDPTYQPYAKTNVELTQDVAEATDIVNVEGFSWDSAVDGTKTLNVKRIGHFISIYGYFQSSATLPQWTKIVTGLPKPTQVASSSDAITGCVVNVETDGNAGALVIQNIPAADTRVRLSMIYLA